MKNVMRPASAPDSQARYVFGHGLLASDREFFRTLTQTLPSLVWIKNPQGIYLAGNPRVEACFGISEAQFVGKTDAELIDSKVAEIFREHDLQAVATNKPVVHEQWLRFAHDGHRELLEITRTPLYDDAGRLFGVLGVGRDMTERNNKEIALREDKDFLRTIIDAIPDPVMVKDYKGDFLLCNQMVADLYGTNPESMVGKHDGDFGVPGNLAKYFRENVLAIMASGKPKIVFEDSQDASSGELRHYKSIKIPFRDREGNNQILVIAHDITDVVQAKEKVAESERLLREMLNVTQEGTWNWHIPTKSVVHNAQWYRAMNLTQEEVPPTIEAFVERIYAEDRDLVWQRIQALLKGDTDRYNSQHRLLCKDGSLIWVHDRGRVVERDREGNPLRVIGSFTDISYQKEHQRQLEHIAHYDALTNLPNRVLLADRMQQAMTQCTRRDQSLAVVFLDLDGFKAINDSYDHDTGDEFLIAVSRRMKNALRNGDTLARMGGDEFVAMLVDLKDPQECEQVLNRLLVAAAKPVVLRNKTLQVSASIGVALYPQDDVDADLLMRHADQAMYVAKQAGKNRYHFFDVLQDFAIKSQRESIEHVRQALERNEFLLYYQPKVNMNSGEIIGAEALIRWQHPQRGLLLPIEFLSIIDNHPLSVALGEWVIDSALNRMSAWHRDGLDIPVSVNIDAHQLQQKNFVRQISALLASHAGVASGYLELEVLETSALEDIAEVSDVIHACREIGVRFALDDFGTGYSSLTYLKRLPADILKIDRSFVRDMLDDPDDLAIVKGIIGLANAFRREVIAEGVETVTHGELLLSLGCKLAQGYGIARPMPAEELHDWVRRWKPDDAWTA